jgi:hypothetical protein
MSVMTGNYNPAGHGARLRARARARPAPQKQNDTVSICPRRASPNHLQRSDPAGDHVGDLFLLP